MVDPSPRSRPSLSRRLLLAAGAAGLPTAVLAPTAARAEDPVDPDVTDGATRVVDVPLGDVDLEEVDGVGSVRTIDRRGTMLGVTWTGAAPDHAAVRGLAADGSWGPWYELHEALDPMTGETIDGSQPAWLGPVTGLQVSAVRDDQDVTTELTAHVVTTSAATSDGGSARTFAASAAASTTVPGPNAPSFITRAGWGADESLTGGVSTHAQTQAVVVHHTEGSNSYTAAQSAQIIRGILTYHTQSNGWADVGYNAFVDKYGQIFEGRKGGLLLNITGAHARGVNSRTFGISLLGSYTSTQAPAAAREAIAKVAAWRLVSAFHPKVTERSGFLVTVSGLRYPEGSTMSLPRLFSHRDVNLTDCPGTALFNQLDAIRSAIQTRLDGAWRVHLDAFTAAGGEAALGTVTQVAHTDGDYTVTVLTTGLVLSDGDRNAVGYATAFATAWRPAWGRPTGAVTSAGGAESQTFEKGTAVRRGGSVSFSTSRFIDVPPTLQFHDEIEELAASGIVTGWPDGTYRPLDAVARDAMVVFVYRAKGSPAFTAPSRSPFADITPSTMYYKEICWATAQGIVNGFDDSTFRPTEPVQRQAVAAFLYRAAGSPSVSTGAGFSDVPATNEFRREIAWLASKGISTGWPDGTFRPFAATARDAMAAFMVRWMAIVGL